MPSSRPVSSRPHSSTPPGTPPFATPASSTRASTRPDPVSHPSIGEEALHTSKAGQTALRAVRAPHHQPPSLTKDHTLRPSDLGEVINRFKSSINEKVEKSTEELKKDEFQRSKAKASKIGFGILIGIGALSLTVLTAVLIVFLPPLGMAIAAGCILVGGMALVGGGTYGYLGADPDLELYEVQRIREELAKIEDSCQLFLQYPYNPDKRYDKHDPNSQQSFEEFLTELTPHGGGGAPTYYIEDLENYAELFRMQQTILPEKKALLDKLVKHESDLNPVLTALKLDLLSSHVLENTHPEEIAEAIEWYDPKAAQDIAQEDFDDIGNKLRDIEKELAMTTPSSGRSKDELQAEKLELTKNKKQLESDIQEIRDTQDNLKKIQQMSQEYERVRNQITTAKSQTKLIEQGIQQRTKALTEITVEGDEDDDTDTDGEDADVSRKKPTVHNPKLAGWINTSTPVTATEYPIDWDKQDTICVFGNRYAQKPDKADDGTKLTEKVTKGLDTHGYQGDYAFLSMFAIQDFSILTINDKQYKSMIHFLIAEKARKQKATNVEEAVLKAETAQQALQIGAQALNNNKIPGLFDGMEEQLKVALFHKFVDDDGKVNDIGKKLLATKGKNLVAGNEIDPAWFGATFATADGTLMKGKNTLGKYLMELRDHILPRLPKQDDV